MICGGGSGWGVGGFSLLVSDTSVQAHLDFGFDFDFGFWWRPRVW